MLNILAVFIGGGLGSVFRYAVNMTLGRTHFCVNCTMPLATLSVNVIGSFLIGFLYAIFIQKTGFPPYVKSALTVGFCGGLTTFSTFSVETLDLLKNGETIAALGYILLSVVVCVAVCAAGIWAGTYLGGYFGGCVGK